MSHVCEPIADVQSTEDLRRIPINKVGIKDIRHPVRVQVLRASLEDRKIDFRLATGDQKRG